MGVARSAGTGGKWLRPPGQGVTVGVDSPTGRCPWRLCVGTAQDRHRQPEALRGS